MINQTLMKSIKCSSKENSISNSSKLSDTRQFFVNVSELTNQFSMVKLEIEYFLSRNAR